MVWQQDWAAKVAGAGTRPGPPSRGSCRGRVGLRPPAGSMTSLMTCPGSKPSVDGSKVLSSRRKAAVAGQSALKFSLKSKILCQTETKGSSYPPGVSSQLATVYPRPCGGNLCTPPHFAQWQGLSPHGRGKPAGLPLFDSSWRSIPARAGETGITDTGCPVSRVYPRTGGGNLRRMR